MAHDHRLIELVGLDISRQILARGFKKRRFDARLARETGQREDVALVSVFVARNGGVPGFSGRGKSWNENYRLAFTDDVHVEGRWRRLSECPGAQ
jgi:hypothetical protein